MGRKGFDLGRQFTTWNEPFLCMWRKLHWHDFRQKSDRFQSEAAQSKSCESLRSHMGMDPGDSFEATRMYEKEMTG